MFKLFIKLSMAIAVLMLLIMLPESTLDNVYSNAGKAGAANLSRTADYTFVLKTEVLKDYLHFDGSSMKKVVRVKVQYFAGKDTDHVNDYEYFLYNGSDAIGLHKLKQPELQPASTFYIRVESKSGSPIPEEGRAATNAAMRLWLDMKRKHCVLMSLMVPDETLDSVAEELERLYFFPIQTQPETLVDYPVVLPVFAMNSCTQRKFAYSR